jgi:HK97 family phage portal protein
VAGSLSMVKSFFGFGDTTTKSAEGPSQVISIGGGRAADAPVNWWQMGMDISREGRSSMVEACVSAYAQTTAMCPGNHWRSSPEKGRERVTTSALTRILRYPNDYQSISDFLLNAVRFLLDDGNAYALVVRNNRFEPIELHLMSSAMSGPQIAYDGSIFYHLGGNPIVDARYGTQIVVPARDVLHLKLHTPRHPLVGETPMAAAALQLAAGNAALTSQITFFLNQSRPSFVLTTDQKLTPEQVQQLRTLWDDQSKGMNTGGTPILTAGLGPKPIGSSAKDAELAAILKLSDQAIAHVFRVPLQVLGAGDGTFATTEALMHSWRAGGLGFILNHIEEAIGLLFRLAGQPEEYVEFDTSALLRSAFKERVEGWAIGTKAGIFDRNVARADFELAPVKGGDEPWVQQQDVPLSVAAEMAKNPPPASVAPTPAETNNEEPEMSSDEVSASIMASVQRHWPVEAT